MNSDCIRNIIEIYNRALYGINTDEPEKARRCFNTLNYLLVTLINYCEIRNMERNNAEIEDLHHVLDHLFDINLIGSEEKEFLIEFKSDFAVTSSDVERFVFTNKDKLEAKSIYHTLLTLDISITESRYHIVYDNKARDRAGAYYTSDEFAKLIVNKVIKSYIYTILKKNYEFEELNINDQHEIKQFLLNARVADLSSGTGSFIVAYVEFLKKLDCNAEDFIKILQNIYAFDIDPIALQIVKMEILRRSGDVRIIRQMKLNFVLGNTLLDYEVNNISEKIRLIFDGYIYHEKLGIDLKKYSNYFSIILGNPPWEKIRFEDKNFFSNYCPEIARITKNNDRKLMISKLEKDNPNLSKYYQEYSSQIENAKKLIKENNRFEHSANGELNTNSLFTEQAINFITQTGIVALIVKSSLVNTAANSAFFNYIVEKRLIVSINEFINKKKIFPIDSRERFAVILLSKQATESFVLNVLLENIEDINKEGLLCNKQLLSLINPNNGMIPNISGKDDIKLLKEFYSNFNIFEYEYPESNFGRLVHLTSHAQFIHKSQESNTLPIYEGKFIEIYDNKYSTFDGVSKENCYTSKASSRLMSKEEKDCIIIRPKSRYFIDERKWNSITKNYVEDYSIVWRSLTSASNRRTMLASIMPHKPTIQSIQFLQYGSDTNTLLIILALFNSIVFDYLVRLKLSGIDLTQAVIKQIPVPPRKRFKDVVIFDNVESSIESHIFTRIEKLYNNDVELKHLFECLSYEIEKPDIKSTDYKKLIIELDCIIAKAYSLTKSEFNNILYNFQKFYSKNELDEIQAKYME